MQIMDANAGMMSDMICPLSQKECLEEDCAWWKVGELWADGKNRDEGKCGIL